MINEDIERVTQIIEATQTDLTKDHNDWIKLGYALIDGLQEGGRSCFHRISRFYPNYTYEECDKKFDDLFKYGPSKVTVKSFFWMAQQAGLDISPVEISEEPRGMSEEEIKEKIITQSCTKETQRSTEDINSLQTSNNKALVANERQPMDAEPNEENDKIEKYLMREYDFRFNEITGRTEIRKKEEDKYHAMIDFDVNSIHRELNQNKIKCSVTGLRYKFCSDFCKKFNPIKEYITALTRRDIRDYIRKLAKTIKTNNDKLFYKFFKKWLVAVVACALDPNITNQTCLVLAGKQGVGKTTWLLNLIPKELFEYKFSGTLNPSDKDTMVHLSECFLINLDELENMNKTEIGTLKEIITKNSIRIRRPYGYNAEQLVRRASFMGSVNSGQFLNYPTGSRRFLCFTVEKIKLKHNINIDDVWAQAYELYKSGFKHWFDKNEIDEINEMNEQYQCLPMEEELLLKYFEPVKKEEARGFMTATDILIYLKSNTGAHFTGGTEMKLGKALKKHGFERVKKGGIYKWAVRELLITN